MYECLRQQMAADIAVIYYISLLFLFHFSEVKEEPARNQVDANNHDTIGKCFCPCVITWFSYCYFFGPLDLLAILKTNVDRTIFHHNF